MARVIETCWPTIEAYADLESSVAVAQTCRSLHQAIIDPRSKKVKVTHFEIDPFSIRSAATRIPHYLSRSLNSINFPSLQHLHLDFPRTKRRNASGHSNETDDAYCSSFPIFATHLSSAYNLQRLYLSTGGLMVRNLSVQFEGLYEIFTDNLCRCTKLRELTILNSGVLSGYIETLYSVALQQAITRFVKRRPHLDTLTMLIGEKPSDVLYNQHLRSNGIDPILDFFQAAFTIESLNSLSLLVAHQHLDSLFNCAKILSFGGAARPRFVKRLRLGVSEVDIDFQPQSDSAHILDFFSECQFLEYLNLCIPAMEWEGERNAQALKRMLEHKHYLSFITINVYGQSKILLPVLLDSLSLNIEAKILCELRIHNLMDVEKDQCIQLQSSLRLSGMVCEQFQAKINNRGNWDIYTLDNRRLREGELSADDAFDHFITMKYPNRE